MSERRKRYGHGKWPRNQLYAIVASYRSMGREPAWVAARLGVGPRIVFQIFEYLEELEESERLGAPPGVRDDGSE
jgi:hypothetical protein